MGEEIIKYFNYIAQIEGFKGKVLLSQKIKIPITQAAVMPDSPVYINVFKQAIEELTGMPAPDFKDKKDN